jgi:hypothetical protein
MSSADAKTSSADAQAMRRIQRKGLSVSTSKLQLLSIDAGPSMNAGSPIPLSPGLHTPVGYQRPKRAFFSDEDKTTSRMDPNNPCFPTRHVDRDRVQHISNMSRQKSMHKLNEASSHLGNAQEWETLFKELDQLFEMQLPSLAARVKAVVTAVESKRVTATIISDWKPSIVRAFDDVSNVNYILANELHKVTFTSKKPKKMVVEDDGNPDDYMSELLTNLRYVVNKLPQRYEALKAKIDVLTADKVDYDTRLDMDRLKKVFTFVDDAAQVLQNIGATSGLK